MSYPRPVDVGQRTLETATRNDVRQYGQSAMGALWGTAWGHSQGQLFTAMPSHHLTPYDQPEATGRQEAEEMVEAFLDPGYDPTLNVQMSFDLYGSQEEADVGGNFDPSY